MNAGLDKQKQKQRQQQKQKQKQLNDTLCKIKYSIDRARWDCAYQLLQYLIEHEYYVEHIYTPQIDRIRWTKEINLMKQIGFRYELLLLNCSKARIQKLMRYIQQKKEEEKDD